MLSAQCHGETLMLNAAKIETRAIIIAHIFGREAFPFVIRFAFLFLILQISGYLIAGRSFDRTGSYNPAYALFFIFDIVAAMLIWSISKSISE